MKNGDTYSRSVREFAKAFGHPLDAAVLPIEIDKMKIGLIEEEFAEVMDAWIAYRWALGVQAEGGPEEDVQIARTNLFKELQDLKYVVFGYEEAHGWPGQAGFNRVHKSNMSKLDADGKPIYREDGKVLKSELYKPADLTDLVN